VLNIVGKYVVKKYKLAIIGFGNVGQGLTKIISEKATLLRKKFAIELTIVAVCDQFKGSVADDKGLDPNLLLSEFAQYGHLKNIPAKNKGWNAIETINNSGADMLIELAFTDLKTGEPALSHIKQALYKGMHVSMTNKGPVALHFPELQKLAKSKKVKIGIEGTVMSGTPSIYLAQEMLLAAGITKIHGILNGTTNYILG
jgi:homoserine dehydrogenase